MIFEFEGRVVISLEHTPGETNSKLVGTEVNLGLSQNIDRTKYLGVDGLPTETGSRILTDSLIQGLLSNVHNSHERNFRNNGEHIRHIMSELERGFMAMVFEDSKIVADADNSPHVTINFNAEKFPIYKFTTGNKIYEICGIDSMKQKLFIEFADNDILIVDDEAKIELWDGAVIYSVNKIIL